MTQTVTEFFRAKKERSDAEVKAANWSARKVGWLNAISALYADIQNWLNGPIRLGYLRVHAEPRTITEVHLGKYEVEDLILTVGDEHVTFSPKGAVVAGVAGRVDVIGEAGEGTLVVQPDGQWDLVRSKYPELRVVPLTAETLNDLIQSIMRR